MIKSGLITPVTNIEADVLECKKHLELEASEFEEAWESYKRDETNRKEFAHVVEELVDMATACMTLASRLERDSNIPELVNNALLMVGAKNYIRGYHNTPMI